MREREFKRWLHTGQRINSILKQPLCGTSQLDSSVAAQMTRDEFRRPRATLKARRGHAGLV